ADLRRRVLRAGARGRVGARPRPRHPLPARRHLRPRRQRPCTPGRRAATRGGGRGAGPHGRPDRRAGGGHGPPPRARRRRGGSRSTSSRSRRWSTSGSSFSAAAWAPTAICWSTRSARSSPRGSRRRRAWRSPRSASRRSSTGRWRSAATTRWTASSSSGRLLCSVRWVDKDKRLVLIAANMGTAVVSVDSTAVNVALPAIRSDLGGGLAGQQWISNAYLLTLSSLILV